MGHQHIGGARTPGSLVETFSIIDPSDGHLIEAADQAGPEDVDRAVAAAAAAFPDWAGATPGDRSGALNRLAARLSDRADEYAALETAQTGKPIKLQVNIHKEGDHALVDFDGTDAEVPGPGMPPAQDLMPAPQGGY